MNLGNDGLNFLEYFEFEGFPNLLLYAFAKNSSAWIEGFEVGIWHV